MDRKKSLIFNTALLTGTTLSLRCVSMAWQVWLVAKIGSAGIGLLTLVLSVGSMAATFAISGIRFTSTRLVAEEIGRGNPGGVTASVTRCCAYALFFGLAAAAILYLTAERIGFLWIGDARTVLSLEIIAFSLPFTSLGSVLSGYFTSTGHIYKSALAQIAEDLSRIALAAAFLSLAPAGDLEKSCAAVAAAGVVVRVGRSVNPQLTERNICSVVIFRGKRVESIFKAFVNHFHGKGWECQQNRESQGKQD